MFEKGIIKSLLKSLLDNTAETENETAEKPETFSEPEVSDKPSFLLDTPLTHGELQERIASVIEDKFTDYTVEKDVPATAFVPMPHEKARPISLLIKKNGRPVLAIAVATFNNYRSYPTKTTREAIESQKITYIRFFCEYTNTPDYIANRLASYLG